MTDKSQEKTQPETMFADWMKTAFTFWESTAAMWTDAVSAAGAVSTSKNGGEKSRMQQSMDTAEKTWKAFSSVMIESETMETLFKGTGELPGLFMKMAQTNITGFVRLQQQWMEKMTTVGKTVQAYRFEDFDEDIFKSWTDLYEKEIRRFLNIPQVGLTRFYQEKMLQAVDKYNLFQSAAAEFFRVLSLPMEKSFQVMQEKLSELTEADKLPEDSRAVYQMWIKTLEGHYMTLFQSPEYTRTLNKTLDAMASFSAAKKEVLQDAIRHSLPLPTQDEIDELYKEIYVLKKRVKKLEKKLK